MAQYKHTHGSYGLIRLKHLLRLNIRHYVYEFPAIWHKHASINTASTPVNIIIVVLKKVGRLFYSFLLSGVDLVPPCISSDKTFYEVFNSCVLLMNFFFVLYLIEYNYNYICMIICLKPFIMSCRMCT